MRTHIRRSGWILATTFVLTLTSVTAFAQDRLTSAPPAPGRLVDVGGWRLHLYCTGAARPGQPTVILEAGIGDFSVESEPGAAAGRCIHARVLGPIARTRGGATMDRTAHDAPRSVRTPHPPDQGWRAAAVRPRWPFVRRVVSASVPNAVRLGGRGPRDCGGRRRRSGAPPQ